MKEEHFYALLGEFLFALAFADGSIQENEIKELELLVKEELFDPRGDKEVIFAKLRFINCMNQAVDRHQSLQRFIDFCNRNSSTITRHQKQLALKLGSRIEKAYKGASSGEMNLMKQLEEVLGEK